MKKILLLLLITLSAQVSFSQTKFSEGFKDGYKEGYCHNQGIGCLSPQPPSPPPPVVGESVNSYKDGYNRGFRQGLNAQRSKDSEESYTPQERTRYETSSPNFVDDFVYQPNNELLLKLIELKQRQAAANSQRNNYSERDYEINLEKAQDILDMIDLMKGYEEDVLDSEVLEVLEVLNRYQREIESFEYKYQIANNTQYFDGVREHLKEIGAFLTERMGIKYLQNAYLLGQADKYEEVISELFPLVNMIKKIGLFRNNSGAQFYTYSLLTYSYYQTKDFKKAEEFATKAIGISGNAEIWEIYFIRSHARTGIGDYYGSNSDLNYLLDNQSNSDYVSNMLATLYNNKANNFVLLGNYKEAEPLIEKALSLDKTLNYIWDTKGELEYHYGNYSECIQIMTKAIGMGELGNSYYYRGLAKIKLGKKTEGCFDLSRAAELGETRAYIEIKKNCQE